MTALLLVAALAPVQDEGARIRELIARLSDETIEERDAAAEELIALGARAAPALKELAASGAGELRSRAVEILRRIERAERVRGVVGAGRPVTVRWEAKPLREALAELKERSGLDVACSDLLAGERVTFSCENAHVWQAVAGMCRAHGGIVWSMGSPPALAKAPPPRGPSTARGPLFLTLDRVEIARDRPFGAPAREATTVTVFAGWAADCRPAVGRLQIDGLVDDRGTDLRAGSNAQNVESRLAPETRGFLFTYRAPAPPHEEARTVTLRGAVRLQFVVEHEELAFDAPARGGVVRNADMTVTLQALRHTDGLWWVSLRVDFGAKGAPAQPDVALRDADGKEHAMAYSGHGTSARGFAFYTFTVGGAADAVWKQLLVRFPKDVHREDVPFEFKDVPIR